MTNKQQPRTARPAKLHSSVAGSASGLRPMGYGGQAGVVAKIVA